MDIVIKTFVYDEKRFNVSYAVLLLSTKTYCISLVRKIRVILVKRRRLLWYPDELTHIERKKPLLAIQIFHKWLSHIDMPPWLADDQQ